MSLPKRILGRTGLEVTQLGFGAMEIRGNRIWAGRPCSDEQAKTILNAVLDAGVNYIDTSNDYGLSELYLGRHVAARRGEFFLATKCGCHVVYAGGHDETPHVWTRDNIRHNIADSLMKAQTDHVDLLQLHNPTVDQVESGKLVDALRELKREGAIRFLGCSSTIPYINTFINLGVFDVFQIPYSALQRQHENLITKAAEAGAGIVIRGGVARGEPGHGKGGEDKWEKFDQAKLAELLELGESRTSFMLRFTIAHPHCHTTIIGTLQPEHLYENIAAMQRGPLADDVYEEAKRRLADIGEVPEE